MPRKLTLDNFIERGNKVHNNKYDYSKFIYVNNRTKGIIICKIHGEFLQCSDIHLNQGCGCPRCKGDLCRSLKANSINNFLEKIKLVKEHIGRNYDYSHFIYTNRVTKSIIICPKHGEFLQTPSDHLRGYGCPNCCSSKGEQHIKCFLQEHCINFIQQYRFKSCKNKRTLPFDFYLPDLNTCIEYQGQQHFDGWNGDKKLLDYITTNDNIKRNFCKEQNITLYEIKYTDNIVDKLNTKHLHHR